VNALTVYYAQALAADRIKVNALAPSLRATNLTSEAAANGKDPAEAAAAAVRLALLPDDGPTGGFSPGTAPSPLVTTTPGDHHLLAVRIGGPARQRPGGASRPGPPGGSPARLVSVAARQ
jgi:NAD(P)-dependent dehydrogenase (short-subunit alcohol dehydrogenase family)